MSRAKPAKIKAYRVARHRCVHAGVSYEVGDILPELPLDSLNVHLPNLELVEVDDVLVDDTEPETALPADLEE